MGETGHLASNGNRGSYRSFNLTPESLVGIAVHALVSGRPWEDYLVNGEKGQIYVPQNGSKRFDGSPRHKEDVVREDLVLRIINACPSNIHTDFESVDGHLRYSGFGRVFDEKSGNGSYRDFLSEIDGNQNVPVGLLREDEAKHIRRRLSRNHKHIAKLLDAMRKDENPMPDFADQLEEALGEYGYVPAGQSTPDGSGDDYLLF